LTWHHFDPPWRGQEHHDPAGMIALCLQHHKEADVGTFTNAQLKHWKETAARQEVKGGFDWKRETTLFKCGGGYHCNNAKSILVINDTPIIWITRPNDGHDLFNIDLRSAKGERLFLLEDNQWLAVPDLRDIEAAPAANSLSIRSISGDVSLDLKFRNFNVTTSFHS
jgi:hypothetical protein